jgi:hypothetical protein
MLTREVQERNSGTLGRMAPEASRLRLPQGYRSPESDGPVLDWSWARTRLEEASIYWLATADPAGRPHVAPLWGVWVADALYFDGFATARWARNLASNPAAALHLESGTEVVVVDGRVDDVVPPAAVAEQAVAAWSRKYGQLVPEPARGLYRLTPHVARGWASFPADVTRWTFPAG